MKAKFNPVAIWGDQAISSRKSATRHFADALTATHPVERVALMSLAEASEQYADVCEQRAAEYAGKN